VNRLAPDTENCFGVRVLSKNTFEKFSQKKSNRLNETAVDVTTNKLKE
jgi:hypothetical protein